MADCRPRIGPRRVARWTRVARTWQRTLGAALIPEADKARLTLRAEDSPR